MVSIYVANCIMCTPYIHLCFEHSGLVWSCFYEPRQIKYFPDLNKNRSLYSPIKCTYHWGEIHQHLFNTVQQPYPTMQGKQQKKKCFIHLKLQMESKWAECNYPHWNLARTTDLNTTADTESALGTLNITSGQDLHFTYYSIISTSSNSIPPNSMLRHCISLAQTGEYK